MQKIQLTPATRTYKDDGYLAVVYMRDVATGRMLMGRPRDSKPNTWPTAREAMAHAASVAQAFAWNTNAACERSNVPCHFLVKEVA